MVFMEEFENLSNKAYPRKIATTTKAAITPRVMLACDKKFQHFIYECFVLPHSLCSRALPPPSSQQAASDVKVSRVRLEVTNSCSKQQELRHCLATALPL